MKKYCFNCGGKMEFSVTSKPKFCPSCGTPLEASGASQSQETILEDDDDLEDTVSSLSDLSMEGLDFEFDSSLIEVKGQKIGSVMGTLDESQIGKHKLPPRPKTASGNFEEEFKKEAGSLKRSNQSEEDAA